MTVVLAGPFIGRAADETKVGGLWDRSMALKQGTYAPLLGTMEARKPGSAEVVSRYPSLGGRDLMAFTPNVDFAIAPVFNLRQTLSTCRKAADGLGAQATVLTRFSPASLSDARQVIRGIFHDPDLVGEDGSALPFAERGQRIIDAISAEGDDEQAVLLAKGLRTLGDLKAFTGTDAARIEEQFVEKLAASRVAFGPTGDQGWYIYGESMGGENRVCIQETQGIPTARPNQIWQPLSSVIPGKVFVPRHETLLTRLMTTTLPAALTRLNQGTLPVTADPGKCAR